MSIQDLQLEKINLINWITRLQDESVIEKLKKIQAKEDDFSIPTWQQDLTLKRMTELDKQPKSAINFDDMIGRLEKKHDL